jgi:hypothetical protein
VNSLNKNIVFVTIISLTLAIAAIVTVIPFANADSSRDQSLEKFGNKCDKAGDHKDSEKKARQAEDQFERHTGGEAVCARIG